MLEEKNERDCQQPEEKQETAYRPRVVVKFHDYIDLPYVDGVEKEIVNLGLGPWETLKEEFPGVSLNRLFTSLTPEEIQKLVDRATLRELDFKLPNFLTYFSIKCPLGVDPHALVKALSEWTAVEDAYVEAGPTSPPQLVEFADDPRSGGQGYLNAAPDGIGAKFAWTNGDPPDGTLGANGAGIQFVDLEQGWMLNHEDLNDAGITLILPGVNKNTLYNGSGTRPHGTSVLGIVLAIDNTDGGVGIAPAATGHVVSQWRTNTDYDTADAILRALSVLKFGDVLLLETQASTHAASGLPIEIENAVFNMILLASALGIVVIEAGGNGSNDLDTYTNGSGDQVLNRTSSAFRDSGAILVGAASADAPHTRTGVSNYGSRIDCYAWGENVDTCNCDNAGTISDYTTSFAGTSSASAIIAGAALVVQGMAEANLGFRLSPVQMRSVLSDPEYSTVSDDEETDRIGRMPDLEKIIKEYIFDDQDEPDVPDVYIRDFVGDTGDPHTGSISASPDIILRQSEVADPQASFGEGSGTENDNTLGQEAKEGQDNFIYVRMRNRGQAAASNVSANVYWAPPSTLVTPNLWTEIGTVTIPMVPESDVLTVSNKLTWSSGAIPAPGHYCFVGIIGNADDPAPPTADFSDWNNFQRFIRENNNVTWRNFNIISTVPSAPAGFASNLIVLPFLAPGAPDKGRVMGLEVVARVSKTARVWLEMPRYLAEAMRLPRQDSRPERKRDVACVPLNPHGRTFLGKALFAAKSRAELRLLIEIPEKLRDREGQIQVRQLFDDEEVGRVTWRLDPTQWKEKTGGKREPEMKSG